MKTTEYEPFGHEWQKEMNKFSKAELITMLKVRIMTAPKWIPAEEEPKETGTFLVFTKLGMMFSCTYYVNNPPYYDGWDIISPEVILFYRSLPTKP